MATVTKLPADQIKEGMYLDLEGDEYATMLPMGGRDHSHEAEHESTIMMFEYEYAFVEAVERETLTCVRIDCSTISFACPPKHMLTVVDIES